MSSVHAFDHALVRTPGPSVVAGLRAVERGAPSHAGVLAEQQAYVGALEDAGVAVHTLPPLDEFPDSIFVEDAALVFFRGAIVLRPGAPSRIGEAAAIAPELARWFDRVLTLAVGSVEGGDVLVTPGSVMIGLSSRTDRPGAAALGRLLAELGYAARVVVTPPGVLHFKSDCSLLDDETILSTPRLAAAGFFAGHRVLLTPAGEEAAANALRINDRIFVGRDFPQTAEMLETAGFSVVRLANAEIGKIDAGFSCMSLRWLG